MEPGHLSNFRCDSVSEDKEAPACIEGAQNADEAMANEMSGELFFNFFN